MRPVVVSTAQSMSWLVRSGRPMHQRVIRAFDVDDGHSSVIADSGEVKDAAITIRVADILLR